VFAVIHCYISEIGYEITCILKFVLILFFFSSIIKPFNMTPNCSDTVLFLYILSGLLEDTPYRRHEHERFESVSREKVFIKC